MKTRTIHTSILAILLSSSLLTAGTFEIGPNLKASDLATQLGVYSASMIYRQEESFSRLAIGLLYKERSTDGKFKEKQSLVYTTCALPKSTKEQEIKILFSRERSTVIVGSVTSNGKGVEMPPPNALMNPPHRMKDGSLVLMSTYSDPLNNSEEGMKSILELIVIPLK